MSVVKVWFRCSVPGYICVAVSQSFRNAPPITVSLLWALILVIPFSASCVVDEIAGLRSDLKATTR